MQGEQSHSHVWKGVRSGSERVFLRIGRDFSISSFRISFPRLEVTWGRRDTGWDRRQRIPSPSQGAPRPSPCSAPAAGAPAGSSSPPSDPHPPPPLSWTPSASSTPSLREKRGRPTHSQPSLGSPGGKTPLFPPTHDGQGWRARPVVGLDLGGLVGIRGLRRREFGGFDDQVLYEMLPVVGAGMVVWGGTGRVRQHPGIPHPTGQTPPHPTHLSAGRSGASCRC